MKKALTISILLNIILFLLGGYLIHKKGGLDYLESKLDNKQSGFCSYYTAKRQFFENMPNDTNEIIFLGNSISEGCDWSELLRTPYIKNRGINGDNIEGVINRIDEVIESNPEKIFLLIGINDLGRKRTVNQILIDYERLIVLIKDKTPKTEVYIQSILPTYNQKYRKNEDIVEINKGLMELSKKHNLIFVNLFDSFKNDKNELDLNYTYDGLHLNGNGYLIYKKVIEEYVNK